MARPCLSVAMRACVRPGAHLYVQFWTQQCSLVTLHYILRTNHQAQAWAVCALSIFIQSGHTIVFTPS